MGKVDKVLSITENKTAKRKEDERARLEKEKKSVGSSVFLSQNRFLYLVIAQRLISVWKNQ